MKWGKIKVDNRCVNIHLMETLDFQYENVNRSDSAGY